MRTELQKVLQREMGEQGQRCPEQFLGPGGHFPKQLRGQQSPCQSLLLFRPHSRAVIPDGSQAGERVDLSPSPCSLALCSPTVMDKKDSLVLIEGAVLGVQASLVAQLVKNLPAMQETWGQSLGWEGLLEKGMATHSSILAWRIPMDWGAWWA